MSKELKPCPFCGSKEISIHCINNVRYGCGCDCGVLLDGNDTTKESAIVNWNTRTTEKRIAELAKQLSEKGEYGYSQFVVDALSKERDGYKNRIAELEAENEKNRAWILQIDQYCRSNDIIFPESEETQNEM